MYAAYAAALELDEHRMNIEVFTWSRYSFSHSFGKSSAHVYLQRFCSVPMQWWAAVRLDGPLCWENDGPRHPNIYISLEPAPACALKECNESQSKALLAAGSRRSKARCSKSISNVSSDLETDVITTTSHDH